MNNKAIEQNANNSFISKQSFTSIKFNSMMRNFILGLTTLFMVGLSFNAKANVTIVQNPDNNFPGLADFLNVCWENDTFYVLVQNATAPPVALNGVSFAMTMPPGVLVDPGSVTTWDAFPTNGATVGDAAGFDPDNPVWDLSAALPAGEAVGFYFTATANCESRAFIDNGGAATNTLDVSWTGGSETEVSTNYDIKSASLSIINVENQAFDGFPGATFCKDITIRNGRDGVVDFFCYKTVPPATAQVDTIRMGANIYTPASPEWTVSGDTITVCLDGNDIAQFGNKDGIWEINEDMVVTECITVISCIGSGESRLLVEWGCGSAATGISSVCETNLTTSNISFGAIVPQVAQSWLNDTAGTSNTCLGSVSVKRLRLTNNGSAKAINIEVSARSGFSTQTGGCMYVNSYFDTVGINFETSGGMTGAAILDSVSDQRCQRGDATWTPIYNSCFPNGPTHGEVFVTIPIELEPGEYVDVFLPVQTCCYDSDAGGPCAQPLNDAASFKVEYDDPCEYYHYGTNAWRLAEWDVRDYIRSLVEGPTDLSAGEKGCWSGTIDGIRIEPRWNNANSCWSLTLDIPTSLAWSGDSSDMVFISAAGLPWPIDSTSFSGPTDPMTGGGGTVTFFFQKSERQGHSNNAIWTICLEAVCGTGGTVAIPWRWDVTQNKSCDPVCNMRIDECEAPILVTVHCPGPCPGGMNFTSLKAKRLNVGLPDNDNDGCPDGTGVVNENLAAVNRATQGDTLRYTFCGITLDGFDTTTMPQTLLYDNWRYGYAVLKMPTSGYTPVDGTLEIYDASSGSTYTCNNVNTFDNGGNQLYGDISVDALILSGCLPFGFRYDEGDTVKFFFDVKIDKTLSTSAISRIIDGDYFVTPAPLNDPNFEVWQCDDYNAGWTEVGWREYNCCRNNFVFNGCQNIEISQATSLWIGNVAWASEFPFEYREFFRPNDVRFRMPPGFSFQSARMLYRRTCLSGCTSGAGYDDFNYTGLTPSSVSGDTLIFDIKAIMDTVCRDESMGYYFYIRIQPTCATPLSSVETGLWQSEYEVNPQFPGDLTRFNNNSNSTNTNNTNMFENVTFEGPDLVIQSGLPTQDGIEEDACWDVNVFNVASGAIAKNSFFNIPSNSFSNLVITKVSPAPMQVITDPNMDGILELGDITANVPFKFEVCAEFSTCDEDSFSLLLGWDCPGYPFSINQFAFFCDPDSVSLKLLPQIGELTLNISEQPAESVNLCDTIDICVTVRNTKKGTVVDNTLILGIIPNPGVGSQGFSFVADSVCWKYPAGTGLDCNPTYVPDFLGFFPGLGLNIYEWDVDAIIPQIGTDGLKGIVADDDLRVYEFCIDIITDCNFVSGNKIGFLTFGKNTCGSNTNRNFEFSEKINVIGAEPINFNAYSTNLNPPIPDFQPCSAGGSTQVFEIKVTNQGPQPSGNFNQEKIRVFMPSTFSYSGSFNCIMNCPTLTAPTVITGTGLTVLEWLMPAGVGINDTMVWQFDVTASSLSECGPTKINIKTFAESEPLYCPTIMDSCTIDVETSPQPGEFILNVDKADLEITSSSACTSPSYAPLGEQVDIEVCFTNTDPALSVPPNSTLNFYFDANGNGTADGGDVLLNTANITDTIFPGDTVCLNETFVVDTFQACPIIMELIGNTCACDTAEATISANCHQNATSGMDTLFVCSGDTFMIGNPELAAGYIYDWTPVAPASVFNFIDFQNGPSEANPTMLVNNTSLTPDTLLYILYTNRGGCDGFDSAIAVVWPRLQITMDADPTICPTGAVQLGSTITGGSPQFNYLWSPLASLDNPTLANPTATPDSTTTYYLTVTDSSGCTIMDSMTVNVVPQLTVEATASDSVVCTGEGGFLMATGAVNYTWTGDAGNPEADASVLLPNNMVPGPAFKPSIAGTYTFVVYGVDPSVPGCEGYDTITIEAIGAIDIGAGAQPNDTICGNTTVTLQALGGVTGSWYVDLAPAMDTVVGTGILATVMPMATTDYYFLGADINGCPDTAEITIVVGIPPTVAAIGDTICPGATGQLNVTASGGVAPYTYAWTPTTGLSNPNIANPTVTLSATTNYTITVTDANGCEAVDFAQVLVQNPINAAVLPTADEVCINEPYSGATASGGAAYMWSEAAGNPSAGTIISGANTASPTFEASVAGLYNYTVVVTDPALSGCTDSVNFTLQVRDVPPVVTSADTSICEGETVTLFGSGGPTINFYVLPAWTNIGTGSSVNVSPTVATTYGVVVTSAFGCIDTGYINVGVFISPVVAATSGDTICPGGSAQLTSSAVGGLPPYSYQWSPNIGLSDATIANPVSTPGATTVYTVVVTDANGCASNVDTSIVVVDSSLIGMVVPDIANLCEGQSQSMIASGGNKYTWVGSGGNPDTDANVLNNTNSANVTFTATNVGVYSFDVTVEDTTIAGCIDVVNVSINVEPLPAINVTIAPNDTVCDGETITINLTGGGTYDLIDLTTGSSVCSANSCMITPTASTTYRAVVTSPFGCVDSVDIPVVVNPVPVITEQADTSICNTTNPIVPIDYTLSTNIDSWSILSGSYDPLSVVVAGGSFDFDATPSGAVTNYIVELCDANGCCAVDTFDFFLVNNPVVEMTIPTVACVGGDIIVQVDSFLSQYSNAATFTWSFVPAANITFASGDNSLLVVNWPSVGTKTVTLMVNDGGCTDMDQEQIFISIGGPTVNEVITDVTECETLDNGAIDLFLSGGIPPYFFQWTGPNGFSSTNQNIDSLEPGTYNVQVFDANSCISNYMYEVKPPADFEYRAILGVNPTCGRADGEIHIFVSGGDDPYTYEISNSAGTMVYTNTSLDTFDISTGYINDLYTITVIDDNGCTITEPLDLPSVNGPLAEATSTTPATCGIADGCIDFTVTQGTAPYTYDLYLDGTLLAIGVAMPMSNMENICNLAAGEYDIIIRDANGCVGSTVVELDQAGPAPFIVTPMVTNANCLLLDGSISLMGAPAGSTYAWNGPNAPFPNASMISNLQSGIYTVTVTDMNGCDTALTIAVDDIGGPNVALLNTTDINCSASSSGTATFTALAGNGPLTYMVSAGNGTGSIAIGDTVTADGLGAGTYSITLTDINGCLKSFVFTITENDEMEYNVDHYDLTECNSADGEICIEITGGVPPYTVSSTPMGITPSAWQEDVEACISGLSAGLYTINVIDAVGCPVTFNITIENPDPCIECEDFAIENLVTVEEECGLGNGIIRTEVTGGTPPYTFNYLDMSTSMLIGTSVSSSTLDSLTNVSGGVYQVQVIDSTNACIVDGIIAVNTSDGPTLLDNGTGMNDDCSGIANGQLGFTVSGDAPFTYTLYDTLGNVIVPSTAVPGTNNLSIGSLAAGCYILEVTDDNGCLTTEQTCIVSDPFPVGITVSSTDPLCDGTFGEIVLTLVPNPITTTYSWTGPAGAFTATDTASGLAAGVYTVTVNVNGCDSTLVIPLSPSDGPALTVAVDAEPTCPGGGDGAVTITATQGSAVLIGYVIPGLGSGTLSGDSVIVVDNSVFGPVEAGTYVVELIDDNGCRAYETFTITDPEELDVLIDPNDLTACNSADGSICLTITGGTAPYTVALMPSGIVPSVFMESSETCMTGLIADTYIFTITDANNCSVSYTVEVEEPQPCVNCDDFDIASIVEVDADCGTNDGSITITVSGGTPPYTYSYTDLSGANAPVTNVSASTTDLVANLMPGFFTITITDSTGLCMLTDNIALGNNDEPIVIVSSTTMNDDCGGSPTGQLGFTVDGTGLATFNMTYQVWDTAGNVISPTSVVPSTGNLTVNGLAAGCYVLAVTDSNGCQDFIESCIGEDPFTFPIAFTVTEPNCDNSVLGSITFTNPGGASFTFMDGTGAVFGDLDNTETGLVADIYTVSIDVLGCDTTITIELQPSDGPDLTATPLMATACPGSDDGSFSFTATAGSNPIIGYIIPGIGSGTLSGDTTLTITSAIAGTYVITVIDALGCESTAMVTVDEPMDIEVLAETLPATNCTSNDGQFCLSIEEGTAPYTITASAGTLAFAQPVPANTEVCVTDLALGNVSVTITDANGCVVDVMTFITPDTICYIPDTLYTVIPQGESDTLCPTANDLANVASFVWSNCTGDPIDFGSVVDTVTGPNGEPCIVYTAGNTAGAFVDSICVIAIDSNGNADTTVWIISIPGTPDTIFTTIPPGGSDTLCPTADDLGSLDSVAWVNCATGDAIDFGMITDTVVGPNGEDCIVYTAGYMSGDFEDTICVIAYDSNGTPDTTVHIITIPNYPPDTMFATVPTGDIMLLCATGDDIGNIDSVTWESCNGLPLNGMITGNAAPPADSCVIYIGGPSTMGNTDTICEVAWSGGTPDTTVWIIQTPPNPDTMYVTIPVGGTTPLLCPTADDIANSDSIVVTVCGNTVDDGTWTTDPMTGCLVYTAGNMPIEFGDSICVIAYDSNGVPDTTVWIISIFCDFSIDNVVSIAADCGIPNGSLSFETSGGLAPATWALTPTGGAGTIAGNPTTISNLDAGTYQLVVTDAAGCADTADFVINTNQGPDLMFDSEVLPTCLAADGEITVSWTSGTAPYDVSWTGPVTGMMTGATSPLTITGLSAGMYTVVVVDADGCRASYIHNLMAGPGALTASITSMTDASACGGSDGEFDVTATGTAPYDITWTGPVSGMAVAVASPYTVMSVPSGMYTVTVTDASGCVAAPISVVINDGPSATVLVSAQTDVTCPGGSDGSATIDILSGTAPFTIVGYHVGVPAGSYAINGLAAGMYSFTVLDGDGCSTIVPVTIIAPPVLVIPVDVTENSCAAGLDGSICMTTTGGTAPYTITADAGTLGFTNPVLENTRVCITGLAASTVNVTVVDANGCTRMFAVDVDEELNCATPDTMMVTIPQGGVDTLCPTANDLSGVDSVTYVLCDANPLSGGSILGTDADGCVVYMAGTTAGVSEDSICVIAWGPEGPDTTVWIITIPPTPDTIMVTIPQGGVDTLCPTADDLSGVDSVTYVLCDANPLSGGSILGTDADGCVVYMAGTTAGVSEDSICVIAWGPEGPDTTVWIITIPPAPDTVYISIPVTQTTDTICPTADDLASTTSVIYTVCGNTIDDGNVNLVVTSTPPGCVSYTAGNVPGAFVDSFCIIAIGPDGTPDTTVVIITITEPGPDTIMVTIPQGGVDTLCPTADDLSGVDSVTYVLCDANPLSGGSILGVDANGCVIYMAGTTPGIGEDSICVIAWGPEGPDTTVWIITIPPGGPDTILTTIPQGGTDTLCPTADDVSGVDSVTYVLCDANPLSGGSILGVDANGCVIYMAGTTPGIGEDSICVIAWGPEGPDTTVWIITIPSGADCNEFPDTITIACGDNPTLCVPTSLQDLQANLSQIYVNGSPYGGLLVGCNNDTIRAYDMSLGIALIGCSNLALYQPWTAPNGAVLAPFTFSTFGQLATALNGIYPAGNFMWDGVQLLTTTDYSSAMNTLALRSLCAFSDNQININLGVTARDARITLPPGCNTIVLVDGVDGCNDTVVTCVEACPLNIDTIPVTIYQDSVNTVCIPTMFDDLGGLGTTITDCDGNLLTDVLGLTITSTSPPLCFTIDANGAPTGNSIDTLCLITTDPSGNVDTNIIIITIVPVCEYFMGLDSINVCGNPPSLCIDDDLTTASLGQVFVGGSPYGAPLTGCSPDSIRAFDMSLGTGLIGCTSLELMNPWTSPNTGMVLAPFTFSSFNQLATALNGIDPSGNWSWDGVQLLQTTNYAAPYPQLDIRSFCAFSQNFININTAITYRGANVELPVNFCGWVTYVDPAGCADSIYACHIDSLCVPDTCFSIFETVTNATCGASDGAIDITPATGVVLPIQSISWTGPNGFTATTEDITGLAPGTYTVTITDNEPCTESFDIVVGGALSQISQITITAADCITGSGSAIISYAGAGAITWDDLSSTTGNTLNAGAGTYTATITEGACSYDTTIVIPGVVLPVYSISTVDPSCGSANGSITITPTSGILGWTWFDSSTGATVSGLTAGAYTLFIDGIQCDTTISITLAGGGNLGLSSVVTDACSSNGAIDLTVTPAGTYSYAWTGPLGFTASTEDISAIDAGSYIVVVTDTATGCNSTDTIVVADQKVFIVTETTTPSTCGAANGSISLSVAPVGAYSFSWSDGSVGSMLTGLNSGSYWVIVTDNGTGCASDTLTYTVGDSCNVLTANDDPVTMTLCDTSIVIDVLANDIDASLTGINGPTIITGPTNGTITLDTLTGLITYTSNGMGVDTICYVITDNFTPMGVDTAKVIIFTGVCNNHPVANTDRVGVDCNNPVLIPVKSNDFDPNGDSLTVTITGTSSNGTAYLVNGCDILYTPNAGYGGNDTVYYVLCDSFGLCDTASVIITVAGCSNAPVAVNDFKCTSVDTPVAISILSNDYDPNGDMMIPVISDTVNNGSTMISGAGVVTYVPNAGFSGMDTFTYYVVAGGDTSNIATVVITIDTAGCDHPPVAVTDTASTAGEPVVVCVLTNDYDLDGDTITLVAIGSASNGTATMVQGGKVVYTPDPGFVGTDTITYMITDGNGNTTTGIIIITVTDACIAPVLQNVYAGTPNGTSVTVMPNVTSQAGDTLTYTMCGGPVCAGATAFVNPSTGAVLYLPGTCVDACDTVCVQVCNQCGECDTALVVISVGSANKPPIALNDSTSVPKGGVVIIDQTVNDFDPEGGVLITTIVGGPNNGSATVVNGQVVYIPNANFCGIDTICYVITDPAGNTDTAKIFIYVLEGNNPPTAVDDMVTYMPGMGGIDVLGNDYDVNGDSISLKWVSSTEGTATISGSGTVLYTPADPCMGDGIDTVMYAIVDNGVPPLCDTGILIVTYSAADYPDSCSPVLAGDGIDECATFSRSCESGTNPSFTIDLGDDPTTYSGTPTWTVTSLPASGTVLNNNDGTFTYTPPSSSFMGQVNFIVELCDETGLCVSDTVCIDVDCGFMIPDVITPNGDGDNDTWVIPGITEFSNNEIKIFNRWGDEVFASEGYDNSAIVWEGTYDKTDEMLPDGTYYYVLVLDKDDATEEGNRYAGFITLFR